MGEGDKPGGGNQKENKGKEKEDCHSLVHSFIHSLNMC